MSGRSWLAIVAALAAGWGALFVYAMVYLAGDEPLRLRGEPAPPDALGLEYPSGPTLALRPAAPSPTAAAPAHAPAPARPAAPSTPPGATRLPTHQPDYVGTWAPNPAACHAPARRRGFLPATITTEGARAGRTICTFRDGHRTGNAWIVEAACSERGRRWSSQVRLVVEADRLTWSSGRGSTAYTRCRRPG